MDFRIERNDMTGETVFSGRFTTRDLMNIRLDHVDRMVVDTPAESPADFLQSLEILYRRHAEQNEPQEPGDE